MAHEILSIAIFELLPGREADALATLQELFKALSAGGYSRDLLYRDAKSPGAHILLRYWKSEEMRRAALEDPEVLRCWAKLSHEVRALNVYETLQEVRL